MKKRILRVGPGAPYATITAAVAEATAGDVVVVGRGTYAHSSGERFPIYVPPGVSLLGAGSASTIIDGGGSLEWSWRPFRSDQSLIVLRDQSTLSGFTVCNSGGCGVSVGAGAHCVVTDNVVRDNGLHGLLLTGVDDVVVRKNSFANNGRSGVSVPIYRPQPARPGESIFVVCTSAHDNRVVIDGNDIDGSTNQESLTVISDPDDNDARGHVRIFDNRIQTARVAVLLCASFGGSRNHVTVELANNDIRGAGVAVIACGAYPVVRRAADDNVLTLVARGNTLRDCSLGMQLIGAFGPASRNVVDADLVDNALLNIAGAAVRVIGAVGNADAAVVDNRASCRALRNAMNGLGGRALVVDGAAMEVPNGVMSLRNHAEAQLADNALGDADAVASVSAGGPSPVLLRNGPPGNDAVIVDGAVWFDTDDAIAMWWES